MSPIPPRRTTHQSKPPNLHSKLLSLIQEFASQGLAELEMMDFEQSKLHEGLWQTFIVKPSMVLPKKRQRRDLRWLGSAFIRWVVVDELAAAMIDIVQRGSADQISLNGDVVMRGRAALDRKREPQELSDTPSFSLGY